MGRSGVCGSRESHRTEETHHVCALDGSMSVVPRARCLERRLRSISRDGCRRGHFARITSRRTGAHDSCGCEADDLDFHPLRASARLGSRQDCSGICAGSRRTRSSGLVLESGGAAAAHEEITRQHFRGRGATMSRQKTLNGIVMKIGIIGTGGIGQALASYIAKAGYEIIVSNSRGPESLAALVTVNDILGKVGFATIDLGGLASGGRLQQFSGGWLSTLNLIKLD